MNAFAHSAILGLKAAVLLLISHSIGRVIYNLFFHPLSSFPGPKHAAATTVPYSINRIRGLQIRWIKELHDQYGEVVRVAPDELSFTSAAAWKDIYGHKATGKGEMPKDVAFYGPSSAGGNGLFRANAADHARQRRLLGPAFSDKALREQEPLIRTYVDLLISKLSDAASSTTPVDMVRMYNYTAFDIVADLTFGEPLGLLRASAYTPWVAAIFGSLKLGTFASTLGACFPWLTSRVVTQFLVPASLREKSRAHREFTERRVAERLARGEAGRPDIWGLVMRHGGNEGVGGERGLRLDEMQANGATLMVAGTETTATLLSGLTFLLLRDKERWDRLTMEIRAAFKRSEDVNMMALARLPFLNACVEEALRVYPPAPSGFPRVVPEGGGLVGGRSVPAGTKVYLSHFAAYHSAVNFCEPDAFLPERWLPEADSRFAEDRRHVFEPFSYGPRNCIGKNLAYHEVRLIFASVLWHYDIELCQESANWMDQKIYFTWEKGQLLCTLKFVARVCTRE